MTRLSLGSNLPPQRGEAARHEGYTITRPGLGSNLPSKRREAAWT